MPRTLHEVSPTRLGYRDANPWVHLTAILRLPSRTRKSRRSHLLQRCAWVLCRNSHELCCSLYRIASKMDQPGYMSLYKDPWLCPGPIVATSRQEGTVGSHSVETMIFTELKIQGALFHSWSSKRERRGNNEPGCVSLPWSLEVSIGIADASVSEDAWFDSTCAFAPVPSCFDQLPKANMSNTST